MRGTSPDTPQGGASGQSTRSPPAVWVCQRERSQQAGLKTHLLDVSVMWMGVTQDSAILEHSTTTKRCCAKQPRSWTLRGR